MSGRIRTIKPELLTDERTAALSHEAWRLFVSLILMADDHGSLPAAGKQVDGQVFWNRPSEAGIENVLDELVDAGLITLYVSRGQRYAHLTGWKKHQRIDRPSKARYALPDGPESLPFARPSRETRETLARDSRVPTEEVQPSVPPTETSQIARDSRDPRERLAPDLRSPISDHDREHSRDPGSNSDPEPETPTVAAGPLPHHVVSVERPYWIAAYERAVDAGRPDGEPHVFQQKAFRALVSVVEKHCTGDDRKSIDRWIERDVGDFVRAVQALNVDPKFWSGFGPDGLLRWHNETRPGLVREDASRSMPKLAPLPPPPMTPEEQAVAAAKVLQVIQGRTDG